MWNRLSSAFSGPVRDDNACQHLSVTNAAIAVKPDYIQPVPTRTIVYPAVVTGLEFKFHKKSNKDGFEYSNFDLNMLGLIRNHFSISRKNLVRFGIATPRFKT